MRKKVIASIFLGLYLLIQAPIMQLNVAASAPSVNVEEENYIESKAYRSGRGSYRSPAGGYTGGTRSGATPGSNTGQTTRTPGVNEPANRAPGTSTGRFGSFFGGLAAGTLLGSILNPFGFGGFGGAGMGGGFSLIGLLFWAVIIYMAYRVLRRLFGGTR
ncbi:MULTISPECIES: hypothetical protein [Paenibacillus]|uniref:Tim44 domain-containing protein n=1 Tax=Paenibacillus radicis (ex Xue et al. 2023) TaxID=2972489 RepID=A0ABT1YU62_9BACL|nr:hypothetical protein [Paenibacillus radicis (ex Xue et al. 2023)]MCR8636728.1 hypothetical protein [Paenibacillus radicis (ex Xue et al. 2023)]